LSDAQKVACVHGTKEMLRILQESLTNDFDGILLVSTHHGILENICPFGSRCHSEDAAGSWRETKYDHGVLHLKETDHA
jgi:hypothetical protein